MAEYKKRGFFVGNLQGLSEKIFKVCIHPWKRVGKRKGDETQPLEVCSQKRADYENPIQLFFRKTRFQIDLWRFICSVLSVKFIHIILSLRSNFRKRMSN